MRAASRSFAVLAVVLVLAASSLLGCDRHDELPTPTPTTATPTASMSPPTAASSVLSPEAKVQRIFVTRCASCHGRTGKGDGPIAASLTPRPRDYSDPAWQKATTDDALAAVIARGGLAVKMSPTMPPSPDLAGDPAALAAMVKLVRSFGAGS